jgi:hypothetical protein
VLENLTTNIEVQKAEKNKTLIATCRTKFPIVEKTREPIVEKTDENLYPQCKYSVIKHTSKFLNKNPKEITYDDVEKLRNFIRIKYEEENKTSSEIRDLLGSDTKLFANFMSLGLETKLKTCKETIQIYLNKTKRTKSLEKTIYKRMCNFYINKEDSQKIYGKELLKKYNSSELHRDHMYSIYDGWVNQIDPAIIKHPANCQIMLGKENMKKNYKSSITLDELLKRIEEW